MKPVKMTVPRFRDWHSAPTRARFCGTLLASPLNEKRRTASESTRGPLECTPYSGFKLVSPRIMMPQRDGFTTARAIREYPSTSGTFICAYTARDEVLITRNEEGSLFDDYVRKGSSPPRLLSYLNHLQHNA